MVVKIVRRILSIAYEFNTVLEVEDMGFMFGKSSAELMFEVALVVAWNAAVVSRRENL
jgi:hypothetical protein